MATELGGAQSENTDADVVASLTHKILKEAWQVEVKLSLSKIVFENHHLHSIKLSYAVFPRHCICCTQILKSLQPLCQEVILLIQDNLPQNVSTVCTLLFQLITVT